MHHRAAPRVLHLFLLVAILFSSLPSILLPSVALADHTPNPSSVTIAGSLQTEIGCTNDWDPACVTSGLVYDAGDDVWQQTFALPIGSFEYKAALNGSWTENYGSNAILDGPNIPLSLTEAGSVKFYYDHKSHWVTDNRTSTIAVAPGNFQSELGCAGDWQADCLRSWLQDIDGDGVYHFTTAALPPGNYEGKVALNEGWDVNYGAGGVQNGDNIAFTVGNAGDRVTFAWDSVTRIPTITVDSLPPVDLASVAQIPPRNPVDDEVFYFMLPDRFENGDPSNDTGGLTGDRYVTGFDPTDRGFYHGGDIAGVRSQLEYLDNMGVTSIWMTPVFKNKPVQGSGADVSAGYHGYWILDYTQFDPHFGANAELEALIAEAHARGIKIFFDIIVNHTADVIQYAEGVYDYRSKAEFPFRDADGLPFDDLDYAGTGSFPALDADVSFPYTPVVPGAEANAKTPAWLNNPIYYHNRGNSSFSGENSLYGDFYGLDDLFTSHPDVVDGMINIHNYWISNFAIDGFRVDTVKHVNQEFWSEFTPAIMQHAQSVGRSEFFVFGEVFSSNPQLLSFYTTNSAINMPAVLDFRFQEAVRSYLSGGGAASAMQTMFAEDDWFIDPDSNVYSLPTFVGNHDRGRFGYFLNADNGGTLSDGEMLSRAKLANALMYFARGVPVTYYGDEQGFTGDGDDKGARQSLFPSQVASYNDDNLIGTDSTTADDNFDPTHPLYQAFSQYAAVMAANPALQSGAQLHRYAANSAGIYAFSRIDRSEKVEYVVAFNNSTAAAAADVQTFYGSGIQFDLLLAEGAGAAASLTTAANGVLNVSVPALGFVVYKAAAAVPGSSAAPEVSISNLLAGQVVQLGYQNLDGNDIPLRMEVAASVAGSKFTEVTFAVRASGTETFTVAGVDDNAPYRIFYDASAWPEGTQLEFLAVANDLNGHYSGAFVGNITPDYTPEVQLADYNYALIHYQRPGGDYGDAAIPGDFWGLHLWGDGINSGDLTEWGTPMPFLGEDDFGRFAWVALDDATKDLNFIVHRGDTQDPSGDRSFNPVDDGPEIWLKQGDATIYTSQAAAQGYVTVHYNRPDSNYAGWGLHLWGDGLAAGVGTDWGSPRPFDGTDDFGAYVNIPIADAGEVVNFIIHQGDTKDPGPDQFINPWETPAVWIKSADETIYPQRCAADDEVILHYHRPAGDFGDYNSSNSQDFWGMHTWGAADDPGWTTPRRPEEITVFGARFRVPLTDPAAAFNYILHRGDTKDPGPNQTLDRDLYGCEVWQLQGADPDISYIRPIVRGAAGAGDLSLQRAHWINRSTIAWNIEPQANLSYALHYAPAGGMILANNVISGGLSIPLFLDPAGLSAAQKTQWPHLADFTVFRLRASDLALVPEILKGQIAVSAGQSGFAADATGLQIPGVLDDLYTYDGSLGTTFAAGGAPTMRVWAPTAKSVKLHLYDDATTATPSQSIAMTAGDKGVWSAAGDASWKGKYYLYEVEVYVHSTGQVVHNLVTDPYSVALSMNSTRTLIADLSDPTLAPTGWGSTPKPPLVAPEDISIYELHVRDFSINDQSVPAEARGTFKAFTYADSNGMNHLEALQEAGLTHLHLLPVFDIATINENKAERVEPNVPAAAPDSSEQQAAVSAVADLDGFNWGYDPFHFDTPEGSYSTDPNGVTRIVEFREMVNALHASGLRVVMDVVYNHTNASGQAAKSVFDKIVPGYYHRLNLDGAIETSTCCQNTASEHAMFEKFMVDSLVMWASQYKIDAFRFDLMGHHMKSNMLKVQAALNTVDPTIYLYGEGWNFGEVASNARGVNATQVNMAGTGIGTFSDRLRDAARGGGPFDGGDAIVRNQGFINGLWYDPNALNDGSEDEKAQLLHLADLVRLGLAGNLADYVMVNAAGVTVTGSQVDYNGSPAGYTQDPQEHIVYVAKHDNQTLYDINAYKLPLDTSMADRVRVQNLGLDLTLLAQGVPFIHAGEDLLRSKSMDRDSYNSGDWFNRLDWTYQSNNFGVGLPIEGVNSANWSLIGPRLADANLMPAAADLQASAAHAQELLQIRDSSALFRLQTEADVMARLQFSNTGASQIPGLIVMRLSDEVVGLPDIDGAYEQVVVLFNATDEPQTYTMSDAIGQAFRLHGVQENSADSVVQGATYAVASGQFNVPARTTAVFVKVQALSGLGIEPGALTPAFTPDVYSYVAQLPNLAQSLIVTPTAAANSVLLVNDVAVSSGAAATVPLASGVHPTITVKLVDGSGAVIALYTLLVNRAPFVPNSAWGTLQATPVALQVLAAAGDLDGDSVSVTQVVPLTDTNGVVSDVSATGQMIYTPNSDFVGLAVFGFVAGDSNGGSNDGLVKVAVGAGAAAGEGAPQVTQQRPGQTVTATLQAQETATMTLEIPPGAYPGALGAEDVFFLVYTQIVSPTANTTQPPANLMLGGQQFRLEAFVNNNPLPNLQFGAPVTLTLHYDPAIDIGGVLSETLSLWYWDEAAGAWSQSGLTLIQRDLVNHTITYTLAHLSDFAFFGAATPTALDEELEPTLLKWLYLPSVAR